MGNNSSEITPYLDGSFVKMDFQFWKKISYLPSGQLWKNECTGVYSEVYFFKFQGYKKVLNPYIFRKNHSQYLVSVHQIVIESSQMIQNQYTGWIFLQRIPFRFSNFQVLVEEQALAILCRCLKGCQIISSEYGNFLLTAETICFTEQGIPKIWINQYLASNQPQNRQHAHQQFISRERAIMNLFLILQKKIKYPKHIHKIKQWAAMNYIELVRKIQFYCQDNKIYLPSFIQHPKSQRRQELLKNSSAVFQKKYHLPPKPSCKQMNTSIIKQSEMIPRTSSINSLNKVNTQRVFVQKRNPCQNNFQRQKLCFSNYPKMKKNHCRTRTQNTAFGFNSGWIQPPPPRHMNSQQLHFRSPCVLKQKSNQFMPNQFLHKRAPSEVTSNNMSITFQKPQQQRVNYVAASNNNNRPYSNAQQLQSISSNSERKHFSGITYQKSVQKYNRPIFSPRVNQMQISRVQNFYRQKSVHSLGGQSRLQNRQQNTIQQYNKQQNSRQQYNRQQNNKQQIRQQFNRQQNNMHQNRQQNIRKQSIRQYDPRQQNNIHQNRQQNKPQIKQIVPSYKTSLTRESQTKGKNQFQRYETNQFQRYQAPKQIIKRPTIKESSITYIDEQSLRSNQREIVFEPQKIHKKKQERVQFFQGSDLQIHGFSSTASKQIMSSSSQIDRQQINNPLSNFKSNFKSKCKQSNMKSLLDGKFHQVRSIKRLSQNQFESVQLSPQFMKKAVQMVLAELQKNNTK